MRSGFDLTFWCFQIFRPLLITCYTYAANAKTHVLSRAVKRICWSHVLWLDHSCLGLGLSVEFGGLVPSSHLVLAPASVSGKRTNLGTSFSKICHVGGMWAWRRTVEAATRLTFDWRFQVEVVSWMVILPCRRRPVPMATTALAARRSLSVKLKF